MTAEIFLVARQVLVFHILLHLFVPVELLVQLTYLNVVIGSSLIDYVEEDVEETMFLCY